MEMQYCQNLQQSINSKNLQQAMIIARQMIENNTKVIINYNGQLSGFPGTEDSFLQNTPQMMQNFNPAYSMNTMNSVQYGNMGQYGLSPQVPMNPFYSQHQEARLNPNNMFSGTFPTINSNQAIPGNIPRPDSHQGLSVNMQMMNPGMPRSLPMINPGQPGGYLINSPPPQMPGSFRMNNPNPQMPRSPLMSNPSQFSQTFNKKY